MSMRTTFLTLSLSLLFILPFASNAAQSSDMGTTISKGKEVSKDFRPKKKKKKRHGGGCEAYGRFAPTSAK